MDTMHCQWIMARWDTLHCQGSDESLPLGKVHRGQDNRTSVNSRHNGPGQRQADGERRRCHITERETEAHRAQRRDGDTVQVHRRVIIKDNRQRRNRPAQVHSSVCTSYPSADVKNKREDRLCTLLHSEAQSAHAPHQAARCIRGRWARHDGRAIRRQRRALAHWKAGERDPHALSWHGHVRLATVS